MKKIIFVLLFIMIICLDVRAEEYLGKIIEINGNIDLTYVSTGERFIPYVGTKITKYHKIRTAKKSFVEILLNDGTKIFLRELSVLKITSLKLNQKDKPTSVEVLTGKVRINVNKPSSGRTLILRTPTAIAGVSSTDTDFGVITSKYETKVAVFDGHVDIANSNRSIIKSYRIMKKEESFIQLNKPPTEPVTLPSEILNYWLDYYKIISRNRIVIKDRREDGIIGHILRKRDF